MADKTLQDLIALGAPPATDDVVAVWVTSASATQKVTIANLMKMASIEAYTAGEAITSYRVVMLGSDGNVYHADISDTGNANRIIGVALSSVASGETVQVRKAGLMVDSGWSWSTGAIYCGASGVLTQTAPGSAFLTRIASALSSTQILINIQPSIVLT